MSSFLSMQKRSREWDARKSKVETLSFGLLAGKSKSFDTTLIKTSAKLAKVDGCVCKNEILVVQGLVLNELSVDKKVIKGLFEVFKEEKSSTTPSEKYLQKLHADFSNQPDLLLDTVDYLLELAYSDQNFCPSEERIIQSAMRIFEIEQKIFRALQKQHHCKLENISNGQPQTKSQVTNVRTKTQGFHAVEVFPEEVWKLYQLVNSNPGDSLETIRLNYQLIARNARPSQISINAVPNEKVLKAQERYALATQAYRQILREREI